MKTKINVTAKLFYLLLKLFNYYRDYDAMTFFSYIPMRADISDDE